MRGGLFDSYSRRRRGPGRGHFPPRVPDIGLFPGGGLWAHPGRTDGRETGKCMKKFSTSGMLGDAVPKGSARRRRQGGARADPARALKCVPRVS